MIHDTPDSPPVPHLSLLNGIDGPEDLRTLDLAQLPQLCQELREFLVDAVSKTGGHLGAGLGTVELAVAMHYAFDTPRDKIVWDVGHQAYPHKILTGRKDRFHTLRQYKGISGFLKRSESEYDVFGAGHASTSISAALGIATARDLANEEFTVAAVIGDGAMTGGMAYEAMNNCGILKKDMIVVLNDNNMSIGPNKWAFSDYFNELIASPAYNKFRADVWNLAGHFDHLGDRLRRMASKLEGGIKAVVTPGMLFESLGFRYFGPVQGHQVVRLVKILQEVKAWKGPILLHVVTQKGKGYEPAEQDSMNLHGVTPFDKVTGKSPSKSGPQSFTAVFGDALSSIMRKHPRVVGITAAMPSGTGMDIVQKAVPERTFDVGIAEQHAVTFAAGLATEGFIPVVSIYSTFLQRAFDQIIHDVAIQHLHVVFILDRAGLVGADGPTHHGAYDLSYLRPIPDMTIMAPSDEQELRDMLHTAIYSLTGPVAIRYPRGNAQGRVLREIDHPLPIGVSQTLREGSDLGILAIGSFVDPAMKAAALLAAHGIEARVVDMRFVKPLDMACIRTCAENLPLLVTLEDNSILGGFGSAVAEALEDIGIWKGQLLRWGLPDEFVEHGSQNELFAQLRLDPSSIAERIRTVLRPVVS